MPTAKRLMCGPPANPMTDDQIVDLACFPLVDRDEASPEDVTFAVLVDELSSITRLPLAFVVWPTGAKAMLGIGLGDRFGEARQQLIECHRRWEADETTPVRHGGLH